MVRDCGRYGMKPVCDHPTYCKNDGRALYIGQSNHLAYAPYRYGYYNTYYMPGGFIGIAKKWNGLCSYVGTADYYGRALCNIPITTQNWRYPNQGNPGFMCGKVITTPPTTAPTYPPGTSTFTLFQAPGSSSTFDNDWSGWYSSSSSYTVASGSGKRAAYNTQALTGLRFSDAAGKYAEYRLNGRYSGKTLLWIVHNCMGSTRRNTGGSTWRSGHCTGVGSLTKSNSLSSATSLRIGVGDGGADSNDWCLFMPLSGNGRGDFAGYSIWCFGSEGRTNTGHTGTVTITGVTSGTFSPA
jgi:hypothetical protein